MNTDEKDILDYLKGWPQSFVSGKEIARKANRRRYEQDHGWALSVLAGMVRLGVLEKDALGYYKLKPPGTNNRKKQKHLSPAIRRILERSGKKFEGVGDEQEEEVIATPPTGAPVPAAAAGVKTPPVTTTANGEVVKPVAPEESAAEADAQTAEPPATPEAGNAPAPEEALAGTGDSKPEVKPVAA